ncbi:Release factor glutamine methyltransferase [bacterium HR36]|nr:Release factor glutamine methyltransferase [bacterium HR36]
MPGWDWRRRQCEAERMDDPNLAESAHRQALRELARLNRWGLAVWHLWPKLSGLARRLGRSLRILDLATGGGDIPIALAKRAARRGWQWQVAGCDVSPTAIAYACEQAQKHQVAVEFFVCDVLRENWPGDWDVVMCSLFLHHLREERAVALMQRMGEAGRHLVLISDLERLPVHYGLVWLATRLLCRSPVVRADGPISVRAAYSISEVRRLAQAAWGSGFRLRRRPPARWLLVKG